MKTKKTRKIKGGWGSSGDLLKRMEKERKKQEKIAKANAKAELKEQKRQARIQKLQRETELHTAEAQRFESVARKRKSRTRAARLHPANRAIGGIVETVLGRPTRKIRKSKRKIGW